MARHSYNLGIIGNCSYLALIDDQASVKWLCWPDFDSSFVFGGLLDQNKGGEFSVRPSEKHFTTQQYYTKNTNILNTEFESSDGKFRVTDFAPRFEQYDRHYRPQMLIRKIEPLQGVPEIVITCEPKGEYGNLNPGVMFGSNHLRYMGLEQPIRLTTNLSLHYINEKHPFKLMDSVYLVLTWGVPLEGPVEETAEGFLNKTTWYWQDWIRHCTIGPLWQDAVIRSALTLKLHQFEDTGAIIASATTSLPEYPGSERNWDYRYSWMRDSYYTLKAFSEIGQFEELEKYATYIENVSVAENGHFNPVYNLMGTGQFDEIILDLRGYLGNKPVRIGNQAREHIQNDVYGQILLSVLPLYTDSRLVTGKRKRDSNLIMTLLQGIERTMDAPDAGLWEFRTKSQRHCYTYQFHWAGASAAIKIGNMLGDKAMVKKAEQLKKKAIDQIERCYKPEIGAYSSAIETDKLDAAQLQLITMGYLDCNARRTREHLTKLEKELKADDGLFYRYTYADDFGKPQSTFLICAYWYVEALATVGRLDEASRVFEHLLSFTNHVGLHSEDIDHRDGSQWGNFPQTYSHVGLMNAAFRIARKLDKPTFL